MSKKNDKKLCWSCEGKVELDAERCPYCGTDLAIAASGVKLGDSSSFSATMAAPYAMAQTSMEEPPKPPYVGFNSFTPSNKEWEEALQGDPKVHEKQEESGLLEEKKELFALLLLLPGIVFLLFGIALLLFSKEGVFTLRWQQNFSYFYFIGALPLLYLGYKALK